MEVTDVAFDANPNASEWGRVTSNPTGINCPGDCSEDFAPGTTVTLAATDSPGYQFVQWGVFGNDAGPDCDAAATCTLTVADQGAGVFVTASLRPEAQLLVVPEGAGTVAIDPVEAGRPASPCTVEVPVFEPLPDVCAPRYPDGTRVKVSATPDPAVPGARFVRWSDFRCGRRPTCTLAVRGQHQLSALFSPAYLTVTPGSFGPVSLPPPGGLCSFEPDPNTGVPEDCQFPYPLGANVTLERDPQAAQNQTDEWTGSCTGAGVTCTLRMRKNEHVRAGTEPTLDIPTRVGMTLKVVYAGRRGGRVVLLRRSGPGPARVVCRRTCARAGYRHGDRVLVRARGRRGARFVRWADIGARSRSRLLFIGDRNPIKAVFRRRR